MKFGVSVHDVGAVELGEIACAAEATGFDSVWLGEHVVVPYGFADTHPTAGVEPDPAADYLPQMDPAGRLVDPFVALAAVAAVTTRIRLATGIYIITLRHPLAVARGAATLAEISGGRFVLGLGSGWLREEFDALGVPFGERRTRFEESLDVLGAACQGGPFEHEGRHFRFPQLQVSDGPIRVPLVLGGNSDAALRRAARTAHGWFASGTPTFDQAVELRERLEHFTRAERRSVPLECIVRVPRLDTALVDRYGEAGFDTVLVWAQAVAARYGDDWRTSFQRAADGLGVG
jgi:probable F420-dependent oxidoreductase